MGNLCVVCAVDIEFNAIRSLLSNAKRVKEFNTDICIGKYNNRDIFVIKAGMRAPRIHEQLKYFADKYSFDQLIVAGLAGALDPSLKVGDIVSNHILYSDKIVVRSTEKIALGNKFNADAVDMETEDILRAAKAIGLPTAVLRIISDDANHDLPDFNRALTRNGKLNPWKNTVVMLSNPMASIRFIMGIGKARKALIQAVEAAIN